MKVGDGHDPAATRRALMPFLRPEWPALAGAAGATLVLTLVELAKPWPLALALDKIVRSRRGPFALDAGDIRLLLAVVALVIVIALAEALADYFSDLWLYSAGERITHTLRVAVYEHLHRLSLGYHQRAQKGDLVAPLTEDVSSVGDLFAESLGTIAQGALLLVGMAIVTLAIDPLLALVSFLAIPALGFLSFRYRVRVRHGARVAWYSSKTAWWCFFAFISVKLSWQTISASRVISASGS